MVFVGNAPPAFFSPSPAVVEITAVATVSLKSRSRRRSWYNYDMREYYFFHPRKCFDAGQIILPEGIELYTFRDDRDISSRDDPSVRQRQLAKILKSWVRRPEAPQVDRWTFRKCISSHRVRRFTACLLVTVLLVIVLPILIVQLLPKHQPILPSDDKFTIALHEALRFFDAQRSGNISKINTVPWRGDSGMKDGFGFDFQKNNLVGGYYDGGDAIKYHYPLSFSLTILSWSMLEYGHKYSTIQEYEHARDIIKWGVDYLMKTFDFSASSRIFIQVGTAQNHSGIPGQQFCWERPEDMEYDRPALYTDSAPDLGSEMAAALAAASMVFRDDRGYSKRLLKSAEVVYRFARNPRKNATYSRNNEFIEPFYNSSGYWDEYLWSDIWLFYASGKFSYLSSATDPVAAENAEVLSRKRDLYVFSWDNKLPGALLLLTRARIFLDPGYPYEELLRKYHHTTDLLMCSYLHQNGVFNYTKGGLIQLNHGRPRPLQYAVNAAYLASLYVDYMKASGLPGWECRRPFTSDTLREFAVSQMNYVLGDNPMNISYVVGYGKNYSLHVHHHGASIPKDNLTYSCTSGWKWRDATTPNPNIIYGAMVGGPMRGDSFKDIRSNPNYTEPTLAANAGLVVALVSLTDSDPRGIDKNTMLMSVPPYEPDLSST